MVASKSKSPAIKIPPQMILSKDLGAQALLKCNGQKRSSWVAKDVDILMYKRHRFDVRYRDFEEIS